MTEFNSTVNSFKRGDIVIECYSRELGVVEAGSAELSVVFTDESGALEKRAISPINLEKVKDLSSPELSREMLSAALNISCLFKEYDLISADIPDPKIPGYIGIGNLFPLNMDKVMKNYPYPRIVNK